MLTYPQVLRGFPQNNLQRAVDQMKFPLLLATASLLALTACGGSGNSNLGPGGGGGGGETPENPLPPDDDVGDLPVDGTETCGGFLCSGSVSNITFDGTILTLTGNPFDANDLGGEYAALDPVDQIVDGFTIFQNTDPDQFNRYLAIHEETGAIALGVAAVEGYQDFGYTGAWYRVDDLTTSIPTSGLVQYLGSYGGVMTFEGSSDLLVTTGDVELQVDFTDGFLKGFIDGRQALDPDGVAADVDLPTLVLNDTVITDGSFVGTVNSYDGAEVVETGTYQGFFGGAGATEAGGLVQATNPEFDTGGDADDTDDNVTSLDLGVFTATCGAPADPSC